MATIYDDNDLRFSWNGDLLPDGKGDIKDTSSDALQSLRDQVHIICASTLLDWEIYPNKGAGLDEFVGEPNTRSQANRIHDRLRLAIISANLVDEKDLRIRVVPVHIHKVLIVLSINASATILNDLNPGEKLSIGVLFDSLEKDVFFLDKPPILTGAS